MPTRRTPAELETSLRDFQRTAHNMETRVKQLQQKVDEATVKVANQQKNVDAASKACKMICGTSFVVLDMCRESMKIVASEKKKLELYQSELAKSMLALNTVTEQAQKLKENISILERDLAKYGQVQRLFT